MSDISEYSNAMTDCLINVDESVIKITSSCSPNLTWGDYGSSMFLAVWNCIYIKMYIIDDSKSDDISLSRSPDVCQVL